MESYCADLKGEDGEILVPDLSTTMKVETLGDMFTTLKLSFRDHDKCVRGSLWFHYGSVKSADISQVDQEDLENTSNALECNQEQQYKLTINYCFEKTANNKIGLGVEFKLLLNYLKSEKPLLIEFASKNDGFLRLIKAAISRLETEKDNNPLNRYYKGVDSRCYNEESIISKPETEDTMHTSRPISPRNSFHDKDHYLTTQAVACQIEQSIVSEKVEKFCERVEKILIAEIEKRERPSVSSVPSSSSEQRNQDPGRPWIATILPELPQTPQGYLEAHMSRPWELVMVAGIQKPKIVYDDYKIWKLTKADGLNMKSLNIERDGTCVTINLVVHDALLLRRFRCMQYMHDGDYDYDMTKAVEKVLIAQSLHNIPTYDIFRNLRAEFQGNPEEQILTKLNEGQQKAVEMCKEAPAGIVAVQGPPGTGKTHLIVRMTTPYFMSQAKRKVLVTTQTNIGTDNLALLCQQHLEQLTAENAECSQLRYKYIVRAHASDAEVKNYTMNKRAPRTAKAPPTRNSAPPDQREAMTLLEIGRRMMMLDTPGDGQSLLSHAGDARIEALNKLSLGVRMLEMAGILPTGPKPQNPEVFAQFRIEYGKWLKGEEMGESMLKRVWYIADVLRRSVIRNATVVCTTVANTASNAMMDSLSGTTDLVIADEMPRCLEVDALLLFMGRINPAGYIMVGDPDQLGPYIESNERENYLGGQLRLSIQERLRNAGLPFVFLEEQYRMSPNLSHVANQLVYDGRLKDHTTVLDRIETNQIIAFNKCKFDTDSNLVLLDLQADERMPSSSTKQGLNYSRFNHWHVMYCVNLALELSMKFPEATIAVLTPYQNQYHLLSTAKQKMKDDHFKQHENIRFQKIDAAQGLEYDFVILDLLILVRDRGESASAGFMRDLKRINVATTRGRHGMYVVVDKTAYGKIPYQNGRSGPKFDNGYVHAYMKEWSKESYKVDTNGISCKYYAPGIVEMEERECEDSLCERFRGF